MAGFLIELIEVTILARELEISYQAYQKLENPRKCNPTVKKLEKISSVMGRKLEISFS
jgi:antitoxin HicB